MSNSIHRELKVKRKQKLPKDYAQRVIDLEAQCDRHDVNKDHV